MKWTCKMHAIGFSERTVLFFQNYKNFTTSFHCQIIQKPQPLFLGFSIDSVTYTNLLQSSIKSGSLIRGKLIHAHLIKCHSKPCLFLQNNLLNMYCKCGDVDSGRVLFDRMSKRDVISWNCMISGYSQVGFYNKAIEVFIQGRMIEVEFDRFTYASALSVCARSGDLKMGKIIHGLIVVGGLGSRAFLTNSLIDMYSKCGLINEARILFDNANELDDVSWNSLIAGYSRIGSCVETLRILIRMHQVGMKMNNFSLGSALKVCSSSNDTKEFGKMIHGCAIKVGLDFDIVVGSAMLYMYAKMGRLHEAVRVFNLMPEHNVVVYNAMIAAFFRSEIETSDEFATGALSLFLVMKRRGMKPSKYTFSSILRACNVIETYEHGKQIHAEIIKNNLQLDEFIGSSLIDMYSKSGFTEDGSKCFHSTGKQDIVSWTSMIAGCVRNEKYEEALVLYNESLVAGKKPDQFTVSSALSACAGLAAARSGQQIQGYATKKGFACFTVVGNSQISMYAKSGDVDAAECTFQDIKNRDIVSWSVMIASHGQHGCAREAVRLFEDMKSFGIVPNLVTFLGVLTACSHGGLVDEGLRYFQSMKRDYNMDPNVKHCSCVVDLLGRAGKLGDAKNFIMSSGFKNDPVIWRALLSSCRIYGDTELGKHVAERVIELEPQAAASYVLLYNIYLDAGKQLPAMNVRDLMKERGIKKEPGLSWIEAGSTVHSFVVGDISHAQTQIIYKKLEEMLGKIKELGYKDIKTSAFDESDQEGNERTVNYHSEKLAVAFGMLSLPDLAPIRVMKNLRVCGKCHTTMKFFSRIESREIVLRDPIRFHHFRGGSCSCRDYW